LNLFDNSDDRLLEHLRLQDLLGLLLRLLGHSCTTNDRERTVHNGTESASDRECLRIEGDVATCTPMKMKDTSNRSRMVMYNRLPNNISLVIP
jgi:hypothetical protein